MSSESIYGRIGGREAVETVVDSFYDRVLDDPVLEPYFEGVDMEALYSHQVQFVSAVAGGPVEYEGTDMRTAHEHLDITERAFAHVADHLETALRENGVPDGDVETIMAEVAALAEAVVTA
jgi:hemoglobin